MSTPEELHDYVERNLDDFTEFPSDDPWEIRMRFYIRYPFEGVTDYKICGRIHAFEINLVFGVEVAHRREGDELWCLGKVAFDNFAGMTKSPHHRIISIFPLSINGAIKCLLCDCCGVMVNTYWHEVTPEEIAEYTAALPR